MKIAVLGLGSIGLRHGANLLALGRDVIGYDPDPARRALLLALRYGFERLELNRISMGAQADNAPSQRRIEKAGFKREGVLRNYLYKDGKFTDVVLYSMLQAEFRELWGDAT